MKTQQTHYAFTENGDTCLRFVKRHHITIQNLIDLNPSLETQFTMEQLLFHEVVAGCEMRIKDENIQG